MLKVLLHFSCFHFRFVLAQLALLMLPVSSTLRRPIYNTKYKPKQQCLLEFKYEKYIVMEFEEAHHNFRTIRLLYRLLEDNSLALQNSNSKDVSALYLHFLILFVKCCVVWFHKKTRIEKKIQYKTTIMIYIKSVYHDQISCFLRQFKTTIMIVRNFIFFSLYQYFSFFYFYFILLFINNRFIFFIIYLSLQILNSILRSMFLFKTNTLVLHNPFFSISCPNFIFTLYNTI